MGGFRAQKKMLKMKVDPTMCMKTKTRTTILPTQKRTFLCNCAPFYTEIGTIVSDPLAQVLPLIGCEDESVAYEPRHRVAPFRKEGRRSPDFDKSDKAKQ